MISDGGIDAPTRRPHERLVDVWRRERRQAREQRLHERLRGPVTAEWSDFKPTPSPCPNCGRPGPHFAPPSFGEPGFYTCGTRP